MNVGMNASRESGVWVGECVCVCVCVYECVCWNEVC